MADADRQAHPSREPQAPAPGATPGRAAGATPPPSDDDSAATSTPGRFGRYEIRGALGRGGMGEVLEAWDPELRRTLALKVLQAGGGSSGGQGPARFLEEAQIGGRLDHPGIVPVHDLGHDDLGRPYFTMRLMEGTTLQEILARLHAGDDEWNLVGVLGVLLKVCQAMAFAHDRGVVHRDLKPANVMVGPYGEVTVMDWGLAHRLGEEDDRDLRPVLPEVTALGDGGPKDSPLLTMEGDVIGTPAFMSPEQALGHVHELGPATDVYAVGAILYHTAAGTMPHMDPGEQVTAGEVWQRVREGPPTPLGRRAPHLPAELIAICEMAMAREPSQRYGDMGALAKDLAAYLEGRVVSAHSTGAVAEARKWVARNRPAALAMAVSLAVVVIGSITAAAIQNNLYDKISGARDQARLRRNEAMASLARETAARADAEEATGRAEAAAVRESLVRHEAVAAAQREADARLAAEAAETEARWQAHRANLSAAAAHLALGDLGAAHARLDACDPDLSGWERDVLALRLDPALSSWSAGEDDHLNALALSPDGARVASGGSGRRLQLRDVASGELLAEPPVQGYVRDLVFTPDGRRLVVADGGAVITQRDATTGALLMRMRGHRDVVNAVAASADGRLLASASDDGTVELWEATTGEPLATLGHGGPVAAVALSPDGDTLASAGASGEVRLWSLASRGPVGRLEGHAAPVRALTFGPTGERLVSGGAEGLVVVWDWLDGRRLVEHDAGSEILALDVSPDGAGLLVGGRDGSLQVWPMDRTGAPVPVGGHRGPVHDVAFGSDGARLLSASADGTLRLWDAATRMGPVRIAGHAERAHCVTLSADGALLASGSSDRTVRVTDGSTGDLLHVLEGHAGAVMSLAFALDGRRLASSDYDGAVRLWDLTDGALLAVLERGAGRIAVVSASPDGRLLATARGGRGNSAYAGGRLLQPLEGESEVTLWDAETGRAVRTLPGLGHGTTVAAFSGDGSRLVTGSQAGGLALWDVATGERLRVLAQEPAPGEEPELPPVSFLSVDASGSTIVSAHLSRLLPLFVWDGETGARRAELEGHDTRVWAALLTPDGRRVLSSGEDGTVRVWDALTGDHLLSLAEPGLAGLWLAMDRSGRRLVAPAHDGSLVVWDTDVEQAHQLWQGAAQRQAAVDLAALLLDEHVLPERALTALSSGALDAGDLHERVVAILTDTPTPSPSTLNRQAWEVGRRPGAGEVAYARALLQAELAVAGSPDTAALLNTLGLACHRAGDHERALEILARADERNLASGTTYPRASDLVVRALCLARLGRPEEGWAALDDAAPSLESVTDEELLDLAHEARALLAGTGSQLP